MKTRIMTRMVVDCVSKVDFGSMWAGSGWVGMACLESRNEMWDVRQNSASFLGVFPSGQLRRDPAAKRLLTDRSGLAGAVRLGKRGEIGQRRPFPIFEGVDLPHNTLV